MNLVDQYYAMKGSVTPMKYGTYIRNLKSILHNALEEITYIQHIEPSIAELRQKTSRRVEEMTLHIYIPQQKKGNPKGAKKRWNSFIYRRFRSLKTI